jgi:hypothetical protein
MAGLNNNPEMKQSTFDTHWAAAILVFAALGFLILINRGFRGVSAAGVSVNLK